MRIGFDARMIEHTGIGRYVACLLPEMIKKAGDTEFVLFGSKSGLERFSGSKNVTIREWNAPVYSAREQFEVPSDHMDLDLVHFPHFNVPVFSRKKMVVTIHDLIHLLCPEGAFSPLAKFYARTMIGTALRKASGVITVSESTKNDLVRVYGEKTRQKINVIYEAADEKFVKMTDASRLEEVRRKYSLYGNVILYVGNIKPHKNVETLFEVYERLKQWGVPYQLVIAGRWDSKLDRLKAKVDNVSVKYVGEVPLEDLVCLYNIAGVLLHLSFYEGFGLTILEAMKCGCPVVTTAVSSLPEVAGQAAFYVSPLEVGQIADTVYNVLAHNDYRQEMSSSGIERTKAFSWEKTAEQTLDVYRSLAVRAA